VGDPLAAEIAATDYHTGGEPFRIVTGGVPSLPGRTVADRREHAAARLDHPYPKRTVQHALDHAVSMKRLTRPKRGWYQSANGTAATA
jgi:proline racemase